MAITREKKEALVAEYSEKLRRSQAIIITEYRGLTVKQIGSLRRDLRHIDSEMMISKNTLLARALKDVGLPTPDALLSGPTAVTFCFGELAAPAKTLSKAARDTKVLVLRGGLIGQMVFDEGGIQALSELPSKEHMRAQLVGVLQSPISGLVNVLAGSLRGLVTVLSGRLDQLEQAA